jgi:RNA polymerase sigma-70 factor (ECF subfamily)
LRDNGQQVARFFERFRVIFAVFTVSTGEMRELMEHEDASRVKALAMRAQSGDRGAFDELIERFRPRLLRWILSQMSPRLRSKVEPEDVLQETLIWAFRSMAKLDWRGEEALEHWLFSIAKHVVLKEASRRGPAGEHFLECEPVHDQASPSRALRREERFGRLEAALNTLSQDQRQVVELARLRGMPIREIASRMQRSPDAISHLLSRALRNLKDRFGDTESFGLPARSLETPGDDDD